jgi:Protein of unknown function (DUF3617)
MTRTTMAMLGALWAAGTLADEKVIPLDVKTGQWEMTHTTVLKGVPPIPAELLAQMPPDARARYEAMAPSDAKPRTETRKHCVTAEDLKKSVFHGDNEKDCERKIVTSTSKRLEGRIECVHKDVKQVGTYAFEATDREHVKGTIKMDSAGDKHAMSFNGTFSGRWLGPTCDKAKDEK